MKKILALLAVVLGVVSCQTEPEGLDVNVGGEVETTVCVSLPEATRANADSALGAFANVDLSGDATIRYILKIYQKVGNEYKASTDRQVEYSDEKSVVFPVRLVPNRDYRFVVWADYVEGEADVDYHYNTVDLTNIKLNGEWKPMDETRDAFTGYFDTAKEGKQYTSTSSINITLKRPFAKLRVITTDMVELGYLGINPAYATVEYATAYRAGFNAFTSEAVAANDSDKKIHTVFEIADYADNTDANKVLFTDYFFAENDVVKFTLSVYEDEAKTKPIKSNFFNTDIAAKRNYLTTIQGNILTDGNNVKVTVEDAFAGNENWPDTNTENLVYAAMFGGEVTLTEDVVLTQPLTIVEGANVVINLNGKTISNSTGYAVENYGKLTISGNGAVNGMGGIRSHGGEVTINGGTFTGSSNWSNGTYQHILKAVNTKVVINGGTFDATIQGTNNAMINVSKNSVVTINGGEFRNVVDGEVIPQFAPYMFTYEENGKLIINDGDFYGGWIFNGETSTTDIYGGNFTVSYDGQSFHVASTHVLKVYGGVFSLENGGKLNPTNFLAPGYYALQYEAGKYTVQAFDAASRTLTINSKEDLLKLSLLNEKWKEFFSNGQGTDITDFWTANGGKGADFYYKWEWTIKLNADIDFEGATLNAPISVTKFGCFDGQNHTIKNVTIKNDTDAGLFVASSTKLQNIKLDNVHAIGGYSGNSDAGILASDCSAGIDNITIANSSVEGGKYTGGVVGYGYTYVTNCTLTNCVVKGGYKCGGVIGYICASKEAGHNVTGNTLTNCTVVEAPQHADGKSEYVLGMVVGNYNCNGTCANNVVYDITTTATKVIGKIEAGKVVNESNNVVTFVVKNYNELKSAIIKGGNIEFANDITVDEWIMFTEDLTISNGTLITVKDINVSIDGKGHTLTVNSIESAGNNDQLFQGADVLNISNLTIKYADGLTTGGLGMDSGVIKNVHFIGGGSAASSAAIFPKEGEILVEDCIFDTNGVAFYFDNECDNLTVTGCTFNQKAEKNVILLRGDVKFTNNIINSGRTVNVVSGSPVVTGNNFNNVRLKVYGAATATISYNEINNLEFDGNPYASTFFGNTLSAEAQAALDAATKAN